jgi:hypothetical protein
LATDAEGCVREQAATHYILRDFSDRSALHKCSSTYLGGHIELRRRVWRCLGCNCNARFEIIRASPDNPKFFARYLDGHSASCTNANNSEYRARGGRKPRARITFRPARHFVTRMSNVARPLVFDLCFIAPRQSKEAVAR